MLETQIYQGKCKCGTVLDFRIFEVPEKPNNKKSKIVAWIVYGFCKKCRVSYIQGLFNQSERPIQDRDFIINWNETLKDVVK